MSLAVVKEQMVGLVYTPDHDLLGFARNGILKLVDEVQFGVCAASGRW